MSLVVALNDIEPDRIRRTLVTAANPAGTGQNHHFFTPARDASVSPYAKLVQHDPGRYLNAHFHVVDQFQIVVDGTGTFGRHDVSPYYVHFSRAHTPYGPLLAGKEKGYAFMTLRTRHDPGQQSLAAALEKLKQIPDRQPWQIGRKVTFSTRASGISLQNVPEIEDDQGLLACSLTMAPHTTTSAPDPSSGDGQYVVVVKGSMIYENREHRALTVVFIKSDEDAFQVHAGRQGLEALVLNFPQVKARAVDTRKPSTAAGFKKWQCALCSFAYDEAHGAPEEGIPVGTRWEDVPDTWSCPDCSASKSDFQMVEI